MAAISLLTGRCQSAWEDKNEERDFKILGGGWMHQDEPQALPTKPTSYAPPATAYSDADDSSTPVQQQVSARSTPPDSARLGTAMSSILGHGGAFDLRASMGAPSWSDIKSSQNPPATAPEQDNAPAPPRYGRRPSLAMEQKRLAEEGTSILGADNAWMGPAPSFDSERDLLVQSRRRSRPLSAKPTELRLRESQVLGREAQLYERAAARDAFKSQHQGSTPW